MHGQNHIKFIYAKQAKTIHEYKSLKRRLYKITAATWYNKTCTEKHLPPKYISSKINGNSRQCTNTLKVATHYRINQEIKFLYIKKAKLNQHLYTRHLECAAQWPTCWTTIQKSIDNILQLETDILWKPQQETRRATSKPKKMAHKHNNQPTTSLLPTHTKPHWHQLYQRGTRTTGPGCTIHHTATPQDLLDQPHRWNWKGYKTTGHQNPRRLPPHGCKKTKANTKYSPERQPHTQKTTTYCKKHPTQNH